MVNQRSDNKGGLRELALFAGAGGGILGGKILGWRTVCAVEWDTYAASILVARQNDGCLEAFPIWDDVQTFDGRPWRGLVDVVSGGFPCTDISCAGKGRGIHGEASSMWFQMARIIGEVRPRYVFVENSPMLVKRGLAVVLGNLAQMGYDAKWGIVGAHHVGAPHRRDRIWIVANARGVRTQNGREQFRVSSETQANWKAGRNLWGTDFTQQRWWDSEPRLDRVVNGVANRVDRMQCIGNGQVPRVAAFAWNILTNE